MRPLDQGAPVYPWTVAKEMGRGGRGLVDAVYRHVGTRRRCSEVVEFRLKQQLDHLRDQAREPTKYPEARKTLDILTRHVERLGWEL